MKNTIMMALVSLILISCGNPHISTKDKNDPIRSPIVTECLTNLGSDFQFFFGARAPFMKITECAEVNDEDFNEQPVGQTEVVRTPDYEITHRSEIKKPGKEESVEDFFGDEIYPMRMENPVTLNEVKGKGMGLNSLDGNETARDALLWTFNRPISGFGASMVGLKSTSHQASLKVFDCAGDLLREKTLEIDGFISFMGFISPEEDVCHVSLTAGGLTDAIGVDDFQFINR